MKLDSVSDPGLSCWRLYILMLLSSMRSSMVGFGRRWLVHINYKYSPSSSLYLSSTSLSLSAPDPNEKVLMRKACTASFRGPFIIDNKTTIVIIKMMMVNN